MPFPWMIVHGIFHISIVLKLVHEGTFKSTYQNCAQVTYPLPKKSISGLRCLVTGSEEVGSPGTGFNNVPHSKEVMALIPNILIYIKLPHVHINEVLITINVITIRIM